MKLFKYIPLLALMLLIGAPQQASAQIEFSLPINVINFDGAPNDSYVGVTAGTGFNNASGKINVFGISYEYESSKLSWAARVGYIGSGVGEPTIGVDVGFPLKKSGNLIISGQTGLSAARFSNGTFSTTLASVPAGIAFQTGVDSGEADITIWGMPYVGLGIASGNGMTNTNTDLGLAAGIVFDLEKMSFRGGVDYTDQDFGNPFRGSIGARLALGR